MSIDAKVNKLLETKADIKAAITEKGQSVGDVFSTYADKIRAIETGKDVSGVTATPNDVLSPKVFVDSDGNERIGTIATKNSSNLTASGSTITVPAGYYANQATKSVSTATQATPSVSVNSSGLITASATQTEGYVSAGTKSGTKQLTTQAAKTITPGTSNQTAISAGTYATGAVTVKGDSNLVASNIKSGVSIFGVSGTCAGSKTSYVTTVQGSGTRILKITGVPFQFKRLSLFITNYKYGTYNFIALFKNADDSNISIVYTDSSKYNLDVDSYRIYQSGSTITIDLSQFTWSTNNIFSTNSVYTAVVVSE